MIQLSRVRLLLAALLLAALILIAGLAGRAAAQVVALYDGQLGGTPAEQGFSYLAFGATSTQQFDNGATILDTRGDIGEQAGYFAQRDLTLDRQAGYTLHFVVQILQEEHKNAHRAGFSLIVLSEDLLGLELAFWENEIWVQEGGTGDSLFKHAEGVTFDTTADRIPYELTIQGDTYTLSSQGNTLLSGPLRDYTAFEGFPDVYETPGLLFLGDDTGRGAAATAIAYVAVETEPGLGPIATPLPDRYVEWLPYLKGSD